VGEKGDIHREEHSFGSSLCVPYNHIWHRDGFDKDLLAYFNNLAGIQRIWAGGEKEKAPVS
jgi:hypothetical protein